MTGTKSFFVRTSGCNLRCWFCDTPYASWHPEGERQSVADLLELARRSETRHVVLTGGEPLISPHLSTLCDGLRRHGFHVTIETSGTVLPSGWERLDVLCNLLSLSPKLRGSGPNPRQHAAWASRHERRRMPSDIMRKLIERSAAFQVKFVVDDPTEFDEIDDVVAQLSVTPDHVWIMPQGTTVATLDEAKPWLGPLADTRGYHYCDRMQIRWFGNRRGT